METIVVATGNPNKAIEYREMFGSTFEIKTMSDMGINIDIIEDGLTFEDNALIKVRAIYPYLKEQNVIIMGDDSGLCFDALDGRPGVYSARYARENASYEENNQKLLFEMKDVPENNRSAVFICCIALIFPDGEEWTGRGEVQGKISTDYIGDQIFGYNPLFIENNSGKTFAEMGEESKNAISHRRKALELAKNKIETKR